jgi:hypothetical protein
MFTRLQVNTLSILGDVPTPVSSPFVGNRYLNLLGTSLVAQPQVMPMLYNEELNIR